MSDDDARKFETQMRKLEDWRAAEGESAHRLTNWVPSAGCVGLCWSRCVRGRMGR